VLSSGFQRGRGEIFDAVIWFSDMRDFTALADRVPPAHIVELLDGYFDVVASTIAEHGGEVLKFIGDAVLAIFPVGDDARAAGRRARAAAEQTLSTLAEVSRARAAHGDEPIRIGVALHCGPVMYGNIGARERLDFTVISSAVNETSRLESMCKHLEIPLALSGAFVELAELDDVVDLGPHELKGVRAPLRVFTLRGLANEPRAPSARG
jgi:adenylate cyclase